jgi:hypothetical protein
MMVVVTVMGLHPINCSVAKTRKREWASGERKVWAH